MPGPNLHNRFAWDDFRLVRAIAETGTLAGAAEALGLNHSTVFRRLGAIEEEVGQKLFDRLRQGYEPTAIGADMAERAARMEADVAEFERRLVGCDPRPQGELRLATNDSFAAYLLAPMVAAFHSRHPLIRLDVIVGSSEINLARREADVALRATAEPPETLVGRRLAGLAWAIYATPELRAARPDPDAPDAFWIGYGGALRALPAAQEIERRAGPERVLYRLSSMVGQAEAAVAGLGYAALPCFIGDADSRLVRVGDSFAADRSLWLLTHPDLRHAARVRAFMDFFGEALSRKRALFEGAAGAASPASG